MSTGVQNSSIKIFCNSKSALSFYIMAAKNALLVAGVGVIAYSLFMKGNALQKMNFYPKGVNKITFDGVTPVMTLALAVQNTSGQQMVMRSFAGNVFANDYFIGNVSSYTPTVIRANSESVLFITFRLSLIGIVSNIVNAFNGDGPSQELELSATANVDNYQLPVKIKYKVGI